jgi:GNAT superfamily N-acetyltransferase
MSALYAHGVGVVAAGEALNRDHSAVSYGVRAARLRARKDGKYAEVIQRLTQRAGRVLGKGRPGWPAKGRTARRTISDAPHYIPSRLWKDKNLGSYSFAAEVVTADQAVSDLFRSLGATPENLRWDFPDPFVEGDAGSRMMFVATWLGGIEDENDLVLYIDKLAFTAGRRSRGWGTRFARAIEAWGKRQGAVGALLHAGALWGGDEAAGFWEKQGYEITDLGDGLMGWKFWGSGAEQGRGNLAPTARTAITRGGPSAPAKALQRKKLIRGKVLDYGSGRGEDAEWLRSQGLKVTAYDPHHGPKKKPTGGFDTILVTYVLNVLPAKSQTELVRSVCKLLSPGGRAYLTARTDTCPAPATGVQTCVTAVAGGKVVASGGGFKTWEVRR